MTVPMSPPLLSVRNVTKQFGGTVALDNVSLDVGAGARHGIVGENGAGKSTLMRIVAGLMAPDSGAVEIEGERVVHTPAGAARAGVALVHQELSLIPSLSVAENITLGAQPSRFGVISPRRRKREAADALASLQVELDLDLPVERLSLARRQLVEIAKALRFSPKLLILDEPTSSLTPHETNELLGLLHGLAAKGMTILYISHRIPEITALCNTVTVLRDGGTVASVGLRDTTAEQLVRLMVGRELLEVDRSEQRHQAGDVVLAAEDVRTERIGAISLEVRAGEILGLGGLVGAGRTRLARTLIGLEPLLGGSVRVRHSGRTMPIRAFHEAKAFGVAYVPEDRRGEGIAVTLSVSDNVALPSLPEVSPRGVLGRRRMRDLATTVVTRLAVKPPNIRQRVGRLSGGNQQKVAIGKWLVRRPRLIVLDEPTRGVDVGSKADIHRQIRQAAADGSAVLLVTSDLPELIALSDRIAVMRDGRVVAEIQHEEATEEAVMRLASGLGAVPVG